MRASFCFCHSSITDTHTHTPLSLSPFSEVVVMDDNLLRFVRHEAGEELPGDLVATIDGAAAALHRFRANLWGASPQKQDDKMNIS